MNTKFFISIPLFLHLISTRVTSTPPLLASTHTLHLNRDSVDVLVGGTESGKGGNVTSGGVEDKVEFGVKYLLPVDEGVDVDVGGKERFVPPSLFTTTTTTTTNKCSTLICLWFTSWQFLSLCSVLLAWLLTLTTLLSITNTTTGRRMMDGIVGWRTGSKTGSEDSSDRGIGYIGGSPGMRRFVLIEDDDDVIDSESLSDVGDKSGTSSWRLDKGPGGADKEGKGWKTPRKGTYVVQDTKNDCIVELGTYRMEVESGNESNDGNSGLDYVLEGPTYILQSEKIDVNETEREKLDKIEELRNVQEEIFKEKKDEDTDIIRDVRMLNGIDEKTGNVDKGDIVNFIGKLDGKEDMEIEIMADVKTLYGRKEIQSSDGRNKLYGFFKYQIDIENNEEEEKPTQGIDKRRVSLRVKEGKVNRLVARDKIKGRRDKRDGGKIWINSIGGINKEELRPRRLSLRPVEDKEDSIREKKDKEGIRISLKPNEDKDIEIKEDCELNEKEVEIDLKNEKCLSKEGKWDVIRHRKDKEDIINEEKRRRANETQENEIKNMNKEEYKKIYLKQMKENRERKEGRNEMMYVNKEKNKKTDPKQIEIKENKKMKVGNKIKTQEILIEEGKGVKRKIRREINVKAKEIKKMELVNHEKYVGSKMEERRGQRSRDQDEDQVTAVLSSKRAASFPMDNYQPIYYLLPRKLSLILEEETH